MTRVRTLPMAIVAVAVMLGGVVITKAIGYWNTSSTKEPVKFKEGELAGLPNPADIRGSYTWQDIEKAFGVPAVESARAFSTADRALDPAERVSVLEELYLPILPPGLEIGTGAVRLYVSLYTGLPFEAEEGSVLPSGAIELLAGRPGADAEALRRYSLPGAVTVAAPAPAAPVPAAPAPAAPVPAAPAPGASAPVASAPAASAPASSVPAATSPTASQAGETQSGTGSGQASARAVVGKTTFGDLYDWGLSEAQVAAVIGYQPGPRSQSVRDSAAAAGKEFSEFRTALQALVDALP